MAEGQQKLPGVKDQTSPDEMTRKVAGVEEAMQKYVALKTKRAEITADLDDAKDELFRMMENHEIKAYAAEYNGKTWTATFKEDKTVVVKLQTADREK